MRGEENNVKTVKKADNPTNLALHLEMQTSFKTVLLYPYYKVVASSDFTFLSSLRVDTTG